MRTSSHAFRAGSWRAVLLALVLGTSSASAQTGGPYDLSWSTIDTGAHPVSTAGTYSLDGTVGQPDAGRQSGGAYIIAGGFWNIAAVTVVGVGDPRPDSEGPSLSLGAPNPFSTRTLFRFSITRPQRVELSVFDLRGARIRTLLDEEVVPGRHTASWDGRDGRGKPVPHGVYLVRMSAPEVSGTGKVVRLAP